MRRNLSIFGVVIVFIAIFAIIMRPLTKSEYGSFQAQAISYQMIEQEMLAAAIVMPVVTPSDVASLSSELVTFLSAAGERDQRV